MRKPMVLMVMCITVIQAVAQRSNIDKRLAGMDTSITRMLKDFAAPGCAIAVVEKDRVLFTGGFGYKDFDKKSPVTENTLFAIGSCSKAFTATLLGILEKDGKLELDKPVSQYLPELRFHDEWLTAHITARDMMSHRTGLPRHDYSWYGSNTSRDSLLMRVRHLEPSAELRQRWQYNNFMYLAQGILAEKLTGKKWEDLVRENIFRPLGMTASNFSVNDLQKASDFTFGYTEQKDSIIRMDFMNLDAMGPAGSINSSAKDMAKWVMTWIQGGKSGGEEIIPAAFAVQAMTPQMVVGSGLPSKESPDIFGNTYGLGWFISSYRGHYRVQHGGNIDGFSASTAFFPMDSIGIVVLVNQNSSAVPSVIVNALADRLLKLQPRDWAGMQKSARAKAKQALSSRSNADSTQRKTNTTPTHAMTEYAGRYENPGYGVMEIRNAGDSLRLEYNNQKKFYLQHYHYNVFRVLMDDSEPTADAPKVSFNIDSRGEIATAAMSLEPAVKDIIFTKLPPEFAVENASLEAYVGDYELSGAIIKVYTRGENTLMVLVPGQPDYELVPRKEDEFDIKVAKGYSVVFEREEGKVNALKFVQPNGIFKATRKK